MSDIDLKKNRANAFVASEAFGLATWNSLFLVRRSIHTMVGAIKAESDYVRHFTLTANGDQNALESEELRNLLQLDVISKLMMLIETIYALSDALSANKYDVPKKMSFYGHRIVSRVQKMLKTSNQLNASLNRILALPNPKDLTTLDQEIATLTKLSEATCQLFVERLTAWAVFYDNHSVVYNKLKHGLSLTTAHHVKDETGVEKKDFSLSFAYDRVGSRERVWPPNSLLVSGQALEDIWFDTINIVPFSDDNLILYENLASEIDEWAGYIVDNQMTWAENCGKVYLPGRILPQQKVFNVEYKCKGDEFRESFNALRPTLDGIVKQMYVNPGRSSSVSFFFGTEKALPKLLAKFNIWRSATISVSPKHDTAPPIRSEIRTFDGEVSFNPPDPNLLSSLKS
jgi:hypothetical protein